MNANSKTSPIVPPPTAYQTHAQDFYGANFYVDESVLIPRPETEQLVDKVLSLTGQPILPGVKPPLPAIPATSTIIDVGTGFGCIAITLRRKLPKATIMATDISEAAIKVAQKNAANLLSGKQPISFIISHLLEKVNIASLPTPVIVAANLPYVDPEWPWLNHGSLDYEPSTALYANNHGLALIFELIDECRLKRVDHLILEADPVQHRAIIDYASPDYHHESTSGFILHFSNKTRP